MAVIEKINFPYFVHRSAGAAGTKKRSVFFGADFYNLPRDSNQQLFIDRTNDILNFMRERLPDQEFIYQPHPNETDEYTKLDLRGFTVGEHTIAEIFLYQNAETIDYVFSAQSGASISAFALGFDSVIFLDLLTGALSDETITGYRSYFAGLPEYFFVKSFTAPLPRREALSTQAETEGLAAIAAVINPEKTVWLMANEPSLGLRAALLARGLKGKWPNLDVRLLVVNHRRWNVAPLEASLSAVFNEVVQLPYKRVWYGVGFKNFLAAWRTARFLRQLPLRPGDNLISLWNVLFEENCILSYHRQLNKILFIENRWYQFIYGGGSLDLPASGYHFSWGVRFFNFLVEPVLGLYQTVYKEYKDGKVLNLLRYRAPLEKVYDKVFVLMPWQL